jgi:ATP-dependent Clp protease ATP-binding subunit ClpC
MVERYTETARRVIFLARDEAIQFGSLVIYTRHLGLALLKEEISVLRRLLPPELTNVITQELRDSLVLDSSAGPNTELPFSDSLKRALAHGADVAKALNHWDIGPEHLLLGLLKRTECSTVRILEKHAITWDSVLRELGVTNTSAESHIRDAGV